MVHYKKSFRGLFHHDFKDEKYLQKKHFRYAESQNTSNVVKNTIHSNWQR